MSISKELLDILVCPLSKASLVLDGNTLVSTDKDTRRRYRIEDGIPDLLIEDSEELDAATWTEIMRR
ncbi:MAG TPA: Trm112 family protein, partial [Candidatus Eisenbacteria bacterium]|nr:Trm112 family protein [Candidatus Eisenbacteria bacterium]